MRATVWSAGLLVAGLGITAAAAADYAGPYGHRHMASRHVSRGFIGECRSTRVATVGVPLGSASSDPVIRYTDGVIQDYDDGMLGHVETKPGDPIRLCLVSFSRDCGEDDLPGRTYATGNLRTGAAWTLPDVRSSCQAQ